MSEGVFAGLRGVVVVDSPPGPSKASVGGGVEAVVASLRALPQPIESREQVVGALVAAGLGLPLAQWMTTNLERQGEGFVFRFNLDAVPEMMADFRRQDLWPRVFAPPESARVLLVRGGRSDAWSPADDVRWAEFGGQWPDRAALVSEAGHWVHAEAPEALWTAMAPWLDTAAGA
jgi:pimeloyl-ACP methyl ester carboxylesterase